MDGPAARAKVYWQGKRPMSKLFQESLRELRESILGQRGGRGTWL